MSDPGTLIATEPSAPNLAVDLLPEDAAGSFLLDVSQLDGPHLLGWGEESWVNVVCDVLQLRVTRGASRLQGALTRAEAGSCVVSLEDIARRFDPMMNADAVHPGVPVRVRAWTDGDDAWSEVLFTGVIGTDLDVQYRQDAAPLVSFTAVDVISQLARYSALGRADPGMGAGDDLLERVQRVVAEVGLDPVEVVAPDSDPGYVATLNPSTLADGWGDVNAAVEAELGRVWATRHNQLAVRARGSELAGVVQGTLSDWHGETVAGTVHCCYTDPLVRFGTDGLVNRAVGGRRVPPTGTGSAGPASALVQVDDTYSQARWTGGAPAAHEDRSLELATDAQLRPWAEWLVLSASVPELRVESVTVAPRDSPEAWRAVCASDVGARWYFRLHPELGPPVERTLGILGLTHSITPDSWETTWTTVEAPTPGATNPRGWFTLDLSVLDDGDVLPPFAGPVSA